MYRGPSRDPCVGIIYTHPFRVGGIQAIILSYTYDCPYIIDLSFHFSFLVNATPDANPKVLPGAGPVLTSFVCIVDFRSRDGCWMG